MAGKSPAAKARIRTYDVWREMWKRCTYPTNKSFKNYGGRGIRVCAEWASFRAQKLGLGRRLGMSDYAVEFAGTGVAVCILKGRRE